MATFIDLCNRTLRRLNDVEIQPADFPSVRGIQALVKDSVRASLDDINQSEFEWPFNYQQASLTLTQGQTEYPFPEEVKVVEWDSFQLQNGSDYTGLHPLARERWYRDHRDSDYEAGASGRGKPSYVFPSSQFGFGVTPSPDAAYTLRYTYYRNRVILDAADDEPRTPVAFDHVIVDGAMYHMYLFKENPESAQLAFAKFQQGIKNLQSIYINRFTAVHDTRVNFGGPTWLTKTHA